MVERSWLEDVARYLGVANAWTLTNPQLRAEIYNRSANLAAAERVSS
jgi:hypothetical protein